MSLLVLPTCSFSRKSNSFSYGRFAKRLVLKWRHKVTLKWSIDPVLGFSEVLITHVESQVAVFNDVIKFFKVSPCLDRSLACVMILWKVSKKLFLVISKTSRLVKLYWPEPFPSAFVFSQMSNETPQDRMGWSVLTWLSFWSAFCLFKFSFLSHSTITRTRLLIRRWSSSGATWSSSMLRRCSLISHKNIFLACLFLGPL